MRLVAEDDAPRFLQWLVDHDYPEVHRRWGIGLLAGCYKYYAITVGVQDEEPRQGVVWYHWQGVDAMVVHLAATPGLVITRNLIGDFYKVPELLGAKYLIAHVDSPEVEEFARRAGWGVKPGETSYTTSLPSPWARYDKRSSEDGSIVGRRRGRGRRSGNRQAGEEDRRGQGGGGEGEDRARQGEVVPGVPPQQRAAA